MKNKHKSILKTVIPAVLSAAVIAVLIYFQIPCRIAADKYLVRGIDVSHYQGDIDWEQIRTQGITFAYIKATEGSSYTDEFYVKNIAAAADAGMITGAYHFFSFESSGKQQAEHFIETAGDMAGMMLPAVDAEYYGNYKNNPPDAETVREELSSMLVALEEYYGCKPLIYSTQSFYKAYLEGCYDGYPLWIRGVWLPPAQDWVIWQYSDRLQLDGINGEERAVDGDVCTTAVDFLRIPEAH